MIAARRNAGLILAWSIITARLAFAQTPPEPPQGRPFEKGSWLLLVSAAALSETWNYNESREELYLLNTGFRYEKSRRISLGVQAVTTYVSQRGVDAYAIGWLGGARWLLIRRGARTFSADLDVGMVRAERPVPPRGTRFNYLLQPGVTATWPLLRGTHAAVSFAWLHLSNNSLNGRGHNPDIQAVGFAAGVLIPF